MKQVMQYRILTRVLALLLASHALQACINSPDELPGDPGIVVGDSGTDSEGEGSSSTTGTRFTISNVTISAASGNGNGAQEFSIYFDNSVSPLDTIPKHCSTTTCSCRIIWNEINSASGVDTSYERTILSAITSTGSDFFTKCKVPDAYTSEIPDGTTVKIKVVGNPGTGITLTMSAFKVIKGGTDETADFRDEEGRAFRNIHRYTCFERNERGMSVQSKTGKITQPVTGEEHSYLLGTDFCITKANGAAVGGDDGCEDASSPPKTSAQAYYYNLFVKSDALGQFNFSNDRYYCPKVYETLNQRHNKTALTDYPSGGDAWPLDTTFSLAVRASADWPVGVESQSVLGIAGDPATGSTTCFGDSDGNNTPIAATGKEISVKCVGFARKPNADGSCPYFRDQSGNIRQTFRLRRFITTYPPMFDTNGEVIGQTLPADVVYVVDRPVRSPNPLQPYSMAGPKPCPFAYFDHSGVSAKYAHTAGAYQLEFNNDTALLDNVDVLGTKKYNTATDFVKPGWVATNDPAWDGVNVDGIHLPFLDLVGHATRPNSCAATIPILKYSSLGAAESVSLGTTHYTNASTFNTGGGLGFSMAMIQVRPTFSWAPHYQEDTDFQACAPLANPFKDPPLHFAKDSKNNISWCSMVYPTQVDDIRKADLRRNPGPTDASLGAVQMFTSPRVKAINTAFTLPSTAALSNVPEACTGSPIADDPTAGAFANVSAQHTDYNTSAVAASFDGPLAPHATTAAAAAATCDRTIITSEDFPDHVPLQAPAHDVERALIKDPAYNCAITYDNNGIKSRNAVSPSEGCCGALNSISLFTTPANFVTGTSTAVGPGTAGVAHLEPVVYNVPANVTVSQPPFCQQPNY